MLSIGFYDQIDEIPNTLNRVILRTTTVGYYYHSVNVISLSLAQSDYIKWLTLYNETQIKYLHSILFVLSLFG